jgi:hypothetical protein
VHDPHVAEDAYDSPENAALAEWADRPEAEAHVISVEYQDDVHALVITDTVPTHPMTNNVFRTRRGWVFGHDHN